MNKNTSIAIVSIWLGSGIAVAFGGDSGIFMVSTLATIVVSVLN